MTSIIICEKPSAARNFAKALGGNKGTYDGTPYEIVALRGHLLELVQPHEQVPPEQEETIKKWSLDTLPWDERIFAWKRKPIKGASDCLKVLKAALKGADEAIIATDVDPSGEGELLAWEAMEWAGWSGKTTRMYFMDEAEKSIQDAFVSRKPIESMEKDGDYVKAYARDRFDFLSMQFSRLATCIARQRGFRNVVREGRLKSVMVWLVGEQQKAYENYVKKPFYEARFKDEHGNVFKREGESAERFDSAQDVPLDSLSDSKVVVDSRTEKSKAPGKLLDLAGLSAILAAKGYKAQSILNTYQKMYEDQVVSYPRTEDKVITPEQFAELATHVDAIADVIGVDKSLLTHREPRKTHVKEGGAHGANRPGPRVPKSLDELDKYGSEARDIYEILARNSLSMFAEDYKYVAAKAHLETYPDFMATTAIPVFAGFKAVFDVDAEAKDRQEGEEAENGADFGEVASPFVHEGANKRPQRPTMKWLVARLEKYNVGTGATRTSTIADITKKSDSALMDEKKGVLSLTECGQVSYVLIEGTNIASVEVTEKLFEEMERIGRFESDPDALLKQVAGLVIEDRDVMAANAAKLSPASSERKSMGKCPQCGADVVEAGKILTCSSNRSEKQKDGTWKQVAGCGFKMFGSFFGKKLTKKQIADLLSGKQVAIKGLKSKAGKEYGLYAELATFPDERGLFPIQKVGFVSDKK